MAILTFNHDVDNVNNFINALEESKNSYYVFVGKSDPWIDANGSINEAAVLPANNSVNQVELDVYRDLVYGKILTPSDVIHMSKKYSWANGNVYARYDNNDPDLSEKQFYVITNTSEVYKCIHNGYGPENPNGVPSTVKPSVTQTDGNFTTSDGYVWKYMFTCDPDAIIKFDTNDYFPVTPNTAVVANAVPGTIDNLVLLNAGNNFQIYETGFIKSFVNNYIIQLSSNSSAVDNYYTNSSIYLKSGYGSGQIRRISSYNGLNRLLSVDPAFDYFVNLNLDNINGTITIGDIVTQKATSITFLYNSGFTNSGDIVVQASTGATGIVRKANSSVMKVEHLSNTDFTNTQIIFNTSYSQVQKSGKVWVNTAANGVLIGSNVSTTFLTEFAINDYVRVGEDANNEIRRVTAVNTTHITVSSALTQNQSSANIFLVPSAITVDSLTKTNANGYVVYKNIDSVQLQYSNVTPVNQSFTIGETVSLVDAANTSQNANGTVSFSNSSTIILSNILGSFASNLYIYGLASQTRAYIGSLESYPNITVETEGGGFDIGTDIIIRHANGVATGNASVISTYSSPNELTEFVISPTVNIQGDGNGALAYCTVDTSANNPERSITSIILIDGGSNYSTANVTIFANTLFGNGAIVEAQISPIMGHGYDAYSELRANYVGVSKKFDTAVNESYKLPIYGSYRSVGIIKNPLIEEAVFELSNFDRSTISVGNSSGTFTAGEVVFQSSSNAAGVVVYSNNTYLELKNTTGTFVYDAANTANVQTTIVGLSSNASTRAKSFTTKYFSLVEDVLGISEINPGGTATINQVISNTSVRVTNVVGSFTSGDLIYAPTTNTYSTLDRIYISNGTVNATSSFGNVVVQTARITLTSNTKPFSQFEYISQQTTNARGKVISTVDELDLTYTTAAPFSVGEKLINTTTGANAVIVFANTTSKYLKLSAVSSNGFNETTNRPFRAGDNIQNESGSKTSVINTIYNVLVVADVNRLNSLDTTPFLGKFQVSGNNTIVGNTSGAEGLATLTDSIKLPDLVRNSGKVIYLENLSKFDRSPTSTEQVKLIIKF
jgi:hypothetical protein